MDLTQYYRKLIDFQESNNILSLEKLQKEINDELKFSEKLKKEKETDIIHNYELLLDKKNKILQKHIYILEDSIQEYWIKEQKYKFPKHITQLYNVLNSKLKEEEELKNNIIIYQELNNNYHLKNNINTEKINYNQKKILNDNKTLLSYESNLEKNIIETEQEYIKKNTLYLIQQELFQKNILKITSKYDRKLGLNETEFQTKKKELELESNEQKETILNNRRLLRRTNDIQDQNIIKLQIENVNLILDFLHSKIEILQNDNIDYKQKLHQEKELKLKENQEVMDNILKKMEEIKKDKTNKIIEFKNNITYLEQTLKKLYLEIEHLEKNIKENNEKFQSNIENIKLSKLSQKQIEEDKYHLKIDIDLKSKKASQKYKYYMNFYTNSISNQNHTIYVLQQDIIKLENNYNLDSNLENETNRIIILKDLLESINI